MKQGLVILLCFLIFSATVSSQDKISGSATQIQLEVFGPGGLSSIRFDTRLSKKENGIGLSAGAGGTPLGVLGKSCNRGFQLALPVGLNYLIGKEHHLLEIGGGVVPVITGGTKIFCLPAPGVKEDFFSDNTMTYWYMLAGYRYQPVKRKGVTCRLFISPLLQKEFPLKFWGGGSIGIRL